MKEVSEKIKCSKTIGAVTKCGTAHFVIAIGMVGVLYLSSTYKKRVVVLLRGNSLSTELKYHAKLHVMKIFFLNHR